MKRNAFYVLTFVALAAVTLLNVSIGFNSNLTSSFRLETINLALADDEGSGTPCYVNVSGYYTIGDCVVRLIDCHTGTELTACWRSQYMHCPEGTYGWEELWRCP
jgi:hypothetical protein